MTVASSLCRLSKKPVFAFARLPELVGHLMRNERSAAAGFDPIPVIRAVVDTQSARYNSFLSELRRRVPANGPSDVSVATAPGSDSLDGHPRVRNPARLHHKADLGESPKKGEINPGNITQALKSMASLQVKLGITPIILDYDQSTRKLNIVDRGFP